MAISFRGAAYGALAPLTAQAPGGAIVGVIGQEGSGADEVLALAGGTVLPTEGEAEAEEPRRFIGPAGPLNLAPVATLALHHALALHDPVVRARAVVGIERLRRAGAAILLRSHDTELVTALCDEVWWFHGGILAGQGDARTMIADYQRQVHGQLVDWGRTVKEPLSPSLRRGDGRAKVEAVETLNAQGRPCVVWSAGEPVQVRVRVRFEAGVEDPVVGIMIRTRVGFEVFGTNTELEQVKLGPVLAGETRTIVFSFVCALCPQEYTITAASHDPDGVWHDWLEDAVAFSVSATRYTAGVADLRARVEVIP